MLDIDLSWLMGGKSFTILCTLSRNGCRVNTTALADSGANAFALLDTKCAGKVSEFLNTPIETLEKPIPVKGYNGRVGKPITSMLRLHLRVNGRRQYNTPFLIIDLGNHDIILGRKWLSYLNLLLDVRNRQLIWPTNLQPTPSFVREITVTMKSLLETAVDPVHQADANRRDQAFQKQILRRPKATTGTIDTIETLLTTVNKQPLSAAETVTEPNRFRPPGGGNLNPTVRKLWTPKGIEKHTERLDRQDSLRKMEIELQKPAIKPVKPQTLPAKRLTGLPQVDIYCIGAVGFSRNLKQPDAVVFVASLYEIDRIIEEREIEAIQKESAQDEITNEELIS